MMGSAVAAAYKEERDEKRKEVVISSSNKSRLRKIIVGTCLTCLASLSISMVGGLMLFWWETRYHPTNRQLWMVPLALILLVSGEQMQSNAILLLVQPIGLPYSRLKHVPVSQFWAPFKPFVGSPTQGPLRWIMPIEGIVLRTPCTVSQESIKYKCWL